MTRRALALALVAAALGLCALAVRAPWVWLVDGLTHTAIRLTAVARWIHPRRRAS